MAGEIAQLVKCLPCKHEDQNLIPSIHEQSWGRQYVPVIPGLVQGVRTGGSLELAHQPT